MGINVLASTTVDSAHFALPTTYVLDEVAEARGRGKAECIGPDTRGSAPTSTSADQRDGTSFEKALIVGSTDEEYGWLSAHYSGYKAKRQGLAFQGDRTFDVVIIRTRQGAQVAVYFDVSRFFGHSDQ